MVHHLIIRNAASLVCVSGSHCVIHLMVIVNRDLLLRMDLMMDDAEKLICHFQEHWGGSLLQVEVENVGVP